MRRIAVFVAVILAVAAACRAAGKPPEAFGGRCDGAPAGAPEVGRLDAGQRLAWSDGTRVWALFADCSRPFLAWEGADEAAAVTWADDGTALAFLAGGRMQVRRVDGAAVQAAFDVSNFRWLPDGRLFLVRPGSVEGGVGAVADPATGSAVDVVEAYTRLFAPSPGGSRVAYASYEDCPPGSIPPGAPADYHCSTIWLSGINGADQRQLVSIADLLAAVPDDVPLIQGIIVPVDLRWSSTGDWLMFRMCGISASLCMDERYVFEIRPDGTGLRYVSDSTGAIEWAPDGSRYVMVEEGGRYYDAYPRPLVLRAPGADGAEPLSPGDVEDREPAWSPDGGAIAFTSSPAIRTGVCQICPPEAPEQGIWSMRADGTERRQLTSSPEWQDTAPRWSRDGEWILFLRQGPEYVQYEGYARTQLWVMRPDGSGQRMVADLSGVAPSDRGLAYDWWTP
jgi:dipeptidyl aminopeptidase/acylaminoacyl peptidase